MSHIVPKPVFLPSVNILHKHCRWPTSSMKKKILHPDKTTISFDTVFFQSWGFCIGPRNPRLHRPQSDPGMWWFHLPFGSLLWEKALCYRKGLTGTSATEYHCPAVCLRLVMNGRWEWRLLNQAVSSQQRGEDHSRQEWFAAPALAIWEDVIPDSQQGKTYLNLVGRAPWNGIYHNTAGGEREK